MFSTNWKRAAALSLAGAIVLSVSSSAAAQSARKKPVNRSVATSSQYVYQNSSARAYYGAPVRSGGINYGDGRMGANYNPNQ
jgi:hypothetical protein